MPLKGHTNNPNGRPPKGNAFVEQLEAALKVVEKSKKKTLIQHAVERAYLDDSVLIAILKKILPDQIEHSGKVESEQKVEHTLSDGAFKNLAEAFVRAQAEVSK